MVCRAPLVVLRRLTVLGFAALVLGLLGSPAPAQALTYHVAPGGHDGNAGTPSAPWASIGHAAGVMVAGDTLVIAPGIYREAVDITRSGAPGTYITYQALPGAVLESPDPGQSLNALDLQPGVAYIRLQGFEVRGGYYGAIRIREGAHHVEILDCNLHHNHAGISWLGGAYGLVERCQIHHNTGGGMGFRYGAHDIVVRDTISYNHNDGLGCSGDSDGFGANETAYNLTFERTESFGNSEDGFDIKAANVVIDRSLSHDNTCVGMKLWNTARVQNSLVYGNGRGLALTTVASGGGTVVRLINNTIADNTNLAIGVAGIAGAPYAVEMFNNIVSGNNKLLDYLDCTTLTENFTLFHRSDAGAAHIVKRLGCVSTGASVSFSGTQINNGTWFANSGQGAQSRALAPLYVNPLADDYSLQPGSPAIDAGWSAVAPSVDIEGVSRPQAGGVDIGAHEATALVSLSVVTVGSGTVTSSPAGITCGAACAAWFAPATAVTLTAVPGAGSTFAGWNGAGCGAANPCTTVIGTNALVTATFAALVTPADLVVDLVGLPPPFAAPGDAFIASDTVANRGGTATTVGTTSQYYLSQDASRGGSDVLLTGSRVVAALGPSATSPGSASVTIPSDTVSGTYYLLSCADDLGQAPESDEGNNCRAAAATVQITAPPPPAPANLTVTQVGNPPASAAAGDAFIASDTVVNQGGSATAVAATSRYYLVRDGSDLLLLGDRVVPILAANATSAGSALVTIPSSAPSGTYYLLSCADDLAKVPESNEADNCRAAATAVAVTAPLPPAPGGATATLKLSAGRGDEAWEAANGSVRTLDPMMYLSPGNTVAIRFTGVTIPRDAVIVSAVLETFALDKRSVSTPIAVRYQGEAVGNATPPNPLRMRDLSGRPKTSAFVDDLPGPWVVNTIQASPDLRRVVQEIVARPDWTSGSALTLFLVRDGSSGERTIGTYETKPVPTRAAILTIVTGEPSAVTAEGSPGGRPSPAPATISASPASLSFQAVEGGPSPAGQTVAISGGSGESLAWLATAATTDGRPWLAVTPSSGTTPSVATATVDPTGLAPGSYTGTIAIQAAGATAPPPVQVSLTVEPRPAEPLPEPAPPAPGAPSGPVATLVVHASRGDEAWERPTGVVRTLDPVMYLSPNNTVAIRFQDLAIPPRAVIVSAVLETFALDKRAVVSPIALRYHGEAAGDSPPPSSTRSRDLSTRPKTLAFVDDVPEAWTLNAFEPSPDLRSIVQEIVGRADWEAGNALTLLLVRDGSSGERLIATYETKPSPARAATLTVTYQIAD